MEEIDTDQLATVLSDDTHDDDDVRVKSEQRSEHSSQDSRYDQIGVNVNISKCNNGVTYLHLPAKIVMS